MPDENQEPMDQKSLDDRQKMKVREVGVGKNCLNNRRQMNADKQSQMHLLATQRVVFETRPPRCGGFVAEKNLRPSAFICG